MGNPIGKKPVRAWGSGVVAKISLAMLLTLTLEFVPASVALSVEATKIRISIDGKPVVPYLAASLGYLQEEGLELVPVDVNKLADADSGLQQSLIDGRLDASYDWFHHTVVGAQRNLPIRAVMLLNDAPGVTIFVANRVRNQIRNPGDFARRRVMGGANDGTENLITSYLARRAGAAYDRYLPVTIGGVDVEAVLADLRAGKVDVLTSREPFSSQLASTGLVSTLFHLNSRDRTIEVFGAGWPAQALLMSPAFIEKHPDTVQRLVNAFVRTLRFIDAHSAEEIAARLPPAYFAGEDRAAATLRIAATLRTHARSYFGFHPADVNLVVDALASAPLADSALGQWRAGGKPAVDPNQLYTNRFVDLATSEIPALDSDRVESYEEQVVSRLPGFQPIGQVSGVLRVWGHGRHDLPWVRPLLTKWIEGLQRFHPGITLDYQMHGTSSGVPSLFTGIGDVAILGEEILPEAVAAFERVRRYPPTAVDIATGSVDIRNFDYAQVFFVHEDNPLSRVTLAQMDAVFGAEHRRGSENFRRWGQLGLKGEWRNAPITLYSWKLDDSFAFFIQETVLAGSHRWNCAVREYAHIYRDDGSIYDHGQQILDALTLDRYGIAISNYRYSNPRLKPLALANTADGPYYHATRENLIERRYPLTRTIPAIIDRRPGMPVEPIVREFLRYVLSREGQQAINRDGRYLPLNPEYIAQQLRKIE